MTPVEEFILNSDKLKTAVLEEALRENAVLRERIADHEQVIASFQDRISLLQSKLNAMEAVNTRLLVGV